MQAIVSSRRMPSPTPAHAAELPRTDRRTPEPQTWIAVVTPHGDLVRLVEELHAGTTAAVVVDPTRAAGWTAAHPWAACILDLRGLETHAAELVERHHEAGGPPLVCILGDDPNGTETDVARRRADEVVDADRLTRPRLEVALARAIERHQSRAQLVVARRDRALAVESLRTLVTTSPAAMLVLDDDDRVLFVNAAAERRLGRTSAELCGGPLPTRIAVQRAREKCEGGQDDVQTLAIGWNDRGGSLVVLAEPGPSGMEPHDAALAAVLAPIRDLQGLSQALGARLEHAVDAVAKLRCVLAREQGDGPDTVAHEVLDGLARDLGRALLSVHALTHSAAAQQAAACDRAAHPDRDAGEKACPDRSSAR